MKTYQKPSTNYENSTESSTDPVSPTDTRGPPWSRDVGHDFLNLPDKEDNTRISVISYTSPPPRGSFRARNGRSKPEMNKSAKRTIAMHGAMVVLVIISILAAIGAIIALALILTQASKGPSTKPTQKPYETVQFMGEFRLLADWSPELENTSSPEYISQTETITKQLDQAFMSSVLWRYYNHSEVLSLQNGSIFTVFSTMFTTFREYTPYAPDRPTNISISAGTVASIIVDKFVGGIFTLPLALDSVVIEEVTTTTVTVPPTTIEISSSTRETSDMCHLLEIPVCGDVYNTTTLPRDNQTQVAALFQQRYGPIFASNCSMKAAAFFCSTTFKNCDPATGIEVLPCQQLCQQVAGECRLSLPCDGFPQEPEVCYDGGMTPEITTSPVTTPTLGKCHPLEISVCGDVYNTTTLPRDNQTQVAALFQQRYGPIFDSNCSEKAAAFFCSTTFKNCDPATGIEVLPCQQLCQQVAGECRLSLPCDGFPQEPEVCYDGGMTPEITTSPVTTPTSPTDMCHPLEIPVCGDVYNTTTLPRDNQTQVAALFQQRYGPIFDSNCSEKAAAFFCSTTFKNCDPATGWEVYPCQHLCQEVARDCGLALPCSQFLSPPNVCYDGGSTVDVTSSPVTTPTSPPADKCHPLEYPVCGDVYNTTTLPRDNQTQAAARFEQYFSAIVNSNCSEKAGPFFCSFTFFKCHPVTGEKILPCQKLCQDLTMECKIRLPCDKLPKSPDLCYNGGFEKVTTLTPPVTTLTPPVTTPDLGLCEAVPVQECRVHHTTTVFFSGQNATTLVQRFARFRPILDADCSAAASLFLCSATFPRCQPSEGLPVSPCEDLCTEFMTGCGTQFKLAFPCSRYPPAGANCISSSGPTTEAVTTSKEISTQDISTVPSTTSKTVHNCVDIPPGPCQGLLPYNFTSFPNTFGHTSGVSASAAFGDLLADQSNCLIMEKTQIFCPILFPKCSDAQQIPACRTVCQALAPSCRKFLGLSCQSFPSDDHPDVCVMNGIIDTWAMSADIENCSGIWCNNGMCLTGSEHICNGRDECGDSSDELFCGEESAADCSFENGNTCSYVQDTADQLDWTVHSQLTPSVLTGPRHDHTFRNQSGHYLYLEATGASVGDLARLTLPPRTWSEHCLRLSYHMRGEGMGTLKVLTQQGSSPQTPTLRWAVEGNIGTDWHTAAITLPRGDYSVIIEGSRGTDYSSDVAIDDLMSRIGACPPVNYSCSADQFSCLSTGRCIHSSKRCDTVNDCGDFSDELDCDCSDRQYYFQCNYGNCIKAYLQCDNNTDCVDGSDEVDCQCPRGQVQCPDGECIMSEWLCDGEWDCSDATDEDNCLSCKADEHTCQDYTCVPQDNVCDGENHCKDRSDENYCVRRRSWDNMLEMRHGLSWLPVCAKGWDVTLGQKICAMTGDGLFNGTVRLNYPSSFYLQLDNNNNNAIHWMKNLKKSNSCEDAAVVGIKCEQRGCGTRSVGFVSPFIVGGDKSSAGKWPWMASFTYEGTHECGGTLIAPQFVLTAAHCVKNLVNVPFLLKVVLGGTAWGTAQPTRKQFAVERVISHPDYDLPFRGNDIGLIQLQSPVEYDRYISPACLPDSDEFYPTSSLCFVAGWGRTSPGSSYVANILREAKIKLWQTSKCNSSLAWNGSVNALDFCAGYISGSIGTCQGDSGGPLVCRDATKRWKLVGISSYVAEGCIKPGFPPVFTDVRKQLDWINDHIECKFKCDNGRCLYDKSLICNRRDDCGDNSDETRICLSTVNCTFDDPFLCGYEFESQRWFPASGLGRSSPYPSHDHTQGTYPGVYMASRGRDKLKSPLFRLDTTHCVRFYYNFITLKEILTGDFTVSVDFFSAGGGPVRKLMFRAANSSDAEVWRMGRFELPPGQYQVLFDGYWRQVVSVDDVLVLPGTCADQGCLPGEFPCSLSGCITEAERCNLAVQCTGRPDDEFSCSERKPYNCTFENNLACGITRVYQQTGNSWTLQNGTSNNNIQADHTLRTASGQYIYSTAGEFSEFGVLIVLPEPAYCLQFVYRTFSRLAELTVQAKWQLPNQPEESVHDLLTVSGSRNATWNRVITPLPAAPNITLRFSFSAPPAEQVAATFAAIDDISIVPGVCPAFECPSGEVKCQTEDFCISPSQMCDRHIDCQDLSDEVNCTCKDTEFQCGNGLCIASALKCNGRPDCLDGSDEADICDSRRSVACNFEKEFICGYEITSKSKFTWSRHRGSTGTRTTGPSVDHTYGNYTGYFLYTEASTGDKGDYTELTSPKFSSGVTDNLIFYYHMRGADIGELAVLSVRGSGGTPKRIWSVSGNHGDKWIMGCVPLQSGTDVQVTFLVTRNDGFYGDIAIDDVSLSSAPCPLQTTTPPALQPTAAVNNCGAGNQACSSGQCLPTTMFCNGIPDCPNGEDELGC